MAAKYIYLQSVRNQFSSGSPGWVRRCPPGWVVAPIPASAYPIGVTRVVSCDRDLTRLSHGSKVRPVDLPYAKFRVWWFRFGIEIGIRRA